MYTVNKKSTKLHTETYKMTTQPKTSSLIAALIVAIIFIVTSAGFAAANADDTGFITGTAWFDANGNEMHELNEVVAPGTAVYLQPLGSNAAVAGGIVVFTDAQGVFNFGSVAYGTYRVQAENGGLVEITVSEVNGTVSVDLPVTVNSNGPHSQGTLVNQIFLPLVTR